MPLKKKGNTRWHRRVMTIVTTLAFLLDSDREKAVRPGYLA